MFIILLSYKCSVEEVDQHLETHREYLKKYYTEGNFIASGRKNPRTGGVILAKVDSRKKLDNILKEDPFFINQIADYEVIEFFPAMSGLGYENLINI